MGVPGPRYVGTVTGWGATGVGEWAVSRVPADMAIVVPATIPMVTPLPLGGLMGAGYIVAGIPLGCTTVVWWMT